MAKAKPCCLAGWQLNQDSLYHEFYVVLFLDSFHFLCQAGKDCISGQNFLQLVDFTLGDFDPNRTAAAAQHALFAM